MVDVVVVVVNGSYCGNIIVSYPCSFCFWSWSFLLVFLLVVVFVVVFTVAVVIVATALAASRYCNVFRVEALQE